MKFMEPQTDVAGRMLKSHAAAFSIPSLKKTSGWKLALERRDSPIDNAVYRRRRDAMWHILRFISSWEVVGATVTTTNFISSSSLLLLLLLLFLFERRWGMSSQVTITSRQFRLLSYSHLKISLFCLFVCLFDLECLIIISTVGTNSQ